MWTRERWLTLAELCGFAAVAAALGLAAYDLAGTLAGVATGLLAAGVEGIYLANAYADPGLALSAKPLSKEEARTLADSWVKRYGSAPRQSPPDHVEKH